MRGKLVVDKASKDFDAFAHTLQVLRQHGGEMERQAFTEAMAEYCGLPLYLKDEKVNRAPYNKCKFPLYYGLVRTGGEGRGQQRLCLTPRGQDVCSCLSRQLQENGTLRHAVWPGYRGKFLSLLLESLAFDTFGRNNSGVETSATDVEPPCLALRTVLELGGATREEICYAMYGLNGGESGQEQPLFETPEAAWADIRARRERGEADYSRFFGDWGVANVVKDDKFIHFFAQPEIALLSYDKASHRYDWAPDVDAAMLRQVAALSPIRQPLQTLVYSDAPRQELEAWMRHAFLSRAGEYVYRYPDSDGRPFRGFGGEDSQHFGVLEWALRGARLHPEQDVFLLVEAASEAAFAELLGPFLPLLEREALVGRETNGCSLRACTAEELYPEISPAGRDYLHTHGETSTRFPANFHLIATIMNSQAEPDPRFDHIFTRCCVEPEHPAAAAAPAAAQETPPNEEARHAGGENVIYYGVPGSGKSTAIEQEYAHPALVTERVVFHPEYCYAEFVGQLLPVREKESGKVSYDYVAGPFTRILREAYLHPETRYLLIIEEINRGNAAAIFGDVFQLLDRTSAPRVFEGVSCQPGTSQYGITNADIAAAVYGDETRKVRLPSNLTLAGTMNTSDQNVNTLDTAFQRRWKMRLVENSFERVPDELRLATIADTGVNWQRFCEVINEKIVAGTPMMVSSEDKRLGVFFVAVQDLQDPQQRAFPEKVLRYLWDDAFKLNRESLFALSAKMNTLEAVIRHFLSHSGAARLAVFRDEVLNSLLEER